MLVSSIQHIIIIDIVYSSQTRAYILRNFLLAIFLHMYIYIDRDQLWMTHHRILDKEGWNSKMMQPMSDMIRNDCNTPSDTTKLFPEGHGTALVLFLDNDTSICFDGSPAGMTKAEYQAVVDDFTKGMAENTVYLIDHKKGAGINNLSEDVFNQDFLKWGNEYVNPYTKAASHESVPVTTHQDILLSTSQ